MSPSTAWPEELGHLHVAPGSTLGFCTDLYPAQLCEPGPHGRVVRHGQSRQAPSTGIVPSELRTARHRGGSDARQCGGPVSGRNARRGALQPGRAARALRDRPARVARQTQSDHAAAAPSRVAERSRTSAGGDGGRRRDLAERWLPGNRGSTEGYGSRRSPRGRPRVGDDSSRGAPPK